MRISLKVVAFLWVGLLVIIGGLLYSAYSQLKPETFVALITEQVQKNDPKAELQVGKVSYGFSLDFNLRLQNIILKKSNKILGSIEEVELKVPWWLLLTNRGNAQININKLDIFLDRSEVPVAASGETTMPPKSIKVSLPDYLTDARFTVRAKEVSVRDSENSRRFFTVSKLLVREFQYGKNSAFEINIPIEITHNGVSYVSDLWLFGDVTPEPLAWELHYRGEFRTREATDRFQIEDMVLNGKSTFKPKYLGVHSEVDLSIDKQPVGKGKLMASPEQMKVELDFNNLPMNYFGFVYEEIKNPYLSEMKGHAEGQVNFFKSFVKEYAQVGGKLAFNGDFQLPNKTVLPGKWQISFDNSRWEISFIAPKGEISYFRRSVLDAELSEVLQFNEELGFSGMEIDQIIGVVQPLPGLMGELSKPYFVTTISCKKCLQGEDTFEGHFKYGSSPDQKFYQGELQSEKSFFKVNYSHKVKQNALDVKFHDFRWGSHFNLLEPYFNADSALLAGSLEGRWEDHWETGKWLTLITAKELSGGRGKLTDFIQHTAGLFGIDEKKASRQDLNLSIQNKTLVVKSLLLEGDEIVKISGTLSSDQKSSLILTNPKNNKFKPVKKENIVPYWIVKEEI